MALDGLFLNMALAQIAKEAVGARVDKIYQPSKTELVFALRTRTSGFKLLCSANSSSPRINITDSTFENPKSPPMLCMLLRKKLGGAVITAVRQEQLDRVVYIDFSGTDEIGDREETTLILEIMAQHSNIILVSQTGVIIDAVRRIDGGEDAYRRIMPGVQYVLPPQQHKLDLFTASDAQLKAALLLNSGVILSSALLRSIAGVSPLTARELASRAVGDDTVVSSLVEAQLLRVVREICVLRDFLSAGKPEPTLVFNAQGLPFEFSFRDVTQYGAALKKQSYDDLSGLLDAFYSVRDSYMRQRARSASLYKLVDTLTERTARKLAVREEEQKNSGSMEQLRIFAELITANQYSLKKGASFYEVENYYDNGAIVRIPVNPALTPGANAQKYYKDYRRAKTASELLVKLIEDCREELGYFESVKDALSRASAEAEIAMIRSELQKSGYIHADSSRSRKNDAEKSLKPLEFTTTDGYKLLVGRGNLQNDNLTFKTAEKTDYWFHVTKAPGAHVILCTRGGELTDTAVIEAAQAALRYSSLYGNAKASVDYTQVKNIKKPPGSKPGFVIYNTYYSIIVSAFGREDE